MDDFEKYLQENREEQEREQQAFFKKCHNKIDSGELIYHLLGFSLCERFKLDLRYNGEPPSVVWALVNYYVDEIDEDWTDWLCNDNAPLIRPISQLKKIFPELAIITDDEEEIVDLANKLYGLEIKTDYDCCSNYSEYFYAYSFNFNNFEPLPIDEIKAIKNERDVLSKYGYDTTELDKELSLYGLSDEELEAI